MKQGQRENGGRWGNSGSLWFDVKPSSTLQWLQGQTVAVVPGCQCSAHANYPAMNRCHSDREGFSTRQLFQVRLILTSACCSDRDTVLRDGP